MYKLLIPLVAVLLGSATLLHAQVPVSAASAQPSNAPHPTKLKDAPESACTNFAGTFVLGAAGTSTQSNDLSLDTLFLCFGDSIFINHNPDADLTGDPDPSSTPGVGWAFYNCTPTVTGDNLQLVSNDPCILLSPTSGLPVLAVGNPEGDVWFFNSGFLQTTYNSGQPVQLHFAPITIDSFGVPPTYESAQVGAPPGPCVNVNTGVEFSVVYLNAITAAGITTNFGNDCLGKFRIKGGYPEWDPTARYTITITKSNDPTVKALVYTSPNQFFHGADIVFSVSQMGLYTIVVEDGKSCGFTFQMNMNSCQPVDNLVLSLPELVSPPGSLICVPITVENYDSIVSNSFSLQWDPTVLQYSGVHNYPANTDSSATTRNEQLINQGLLGVIINTNSPTTSIVPNPVTGELFEVCFTVIGQLGDCTQLSFTNLPTQIGIENQQGAQQAITTDTGQVCVNFTPFMSVVEFIDTICPGPGNVTATLKITASGGQVPYDVQWKRILPTVSGTTSSTIATSGGMYTASGLTNGTYEITVTDDNGLGQILIDTITLDLQSIGASLDLTKLPSCFGSKDGVIHANVFVGSTPAPDPTAFTYIWTPAAADTATLTGLGVNMYSVVVKDANGCSATASGTLGQPSKVDDQNITITDAACTGVEDGSISLTIEGGTPFPGSQYNFQWGYSPTDTGTCNVIGTFLENPSVRTQLAAGFYCVTVTDANGCTFIPSARYEVKNLRTVEIKLATGTPIDNVNCFGASDGSISINVVSTPPFANPNFFFVWSPSGTETNTATTSMLSGLAAGTYSVLAADASGCGDTASFVVTEPLKFVLDTAALMNPTCTNMNDGLIRVAGTGGTGLGNQFIYTWDPPAPGNPQERASLVAGTYKVTASDANGCSDSLTFVLTLPLPPAITMVDSTSVKCGSDGCLTVTAPTATSYIWQDTSGATVATTAQACGLPGGIYSIQITDANNCVTQDTFSLAAVEGLYFSDTTINLPTCYGDSNAIVSVGVMGGTAPYSYLWTPGNQMTSTLIQVKAGLYQLKVTDANNCVLTDTFQVLDAPRIQFGLTNYLAATCADSCNGKVTLEVYYSFNGGILPGNFNYLWDDGNTDSIRTNLCPGLHKVTITDGNNCFTIGDVEMQAPDSITATLTTVPTTCFGGNDGSATVVGAGGNGQPFSYAWETNPTTPTITGLTAGDYDVTVSDKNKCQAVFTATVTEPDSIMLTPKSDSILCFGENQGILSVLIAGGNPGVFTYSWANATGLFGTTNPIEMLFAGNYSVTVTDAKGCTGELNDIVLLDPPPVQGSYLPFEPLNCNGDETTLYIDTIFGGRGGPYKYSVDFGVTFNPDFPLNVGGGQHFITYFDQKDCAITDTIDIPEPDPILVTFSPATVEIELGDSLLLEPIITGITSLDSLNFVWSPTEFLHHPDSITPTAYTFESQIFTLTVTDENGCMGTGTIVINVDPNRNVYLPNVFIPGNPRGLNDHFTPLIGRGVERINYMQVYDRWGELLYERKDFFPDGDNLSEGWDGKYGGQYVNPGVYIYIVEARFLDGKVLLYRGDVTVVR